MKYLIIAPHTDDESIACGGTIASLLERGHTVDVITLSCIYDKVNLSLEWVAAMDVLGVTSYRKADFTTRQFYKQYDDILQYLYPYTAGEYDFIFAPNSIDAHSDHSTVGRACERVFKNDSLITYQHNWNSRTIEMNYFVELEKRHIEKKIEALACYKSQQHRSYFNKDYIYANALNTGVMCGLKYSEGFKSINLIV